MNAVSSESKHILTKINYLVVFNLLELITIKHLSRIDISLNFGIIDNIIYISKFVLYIN